MLLVGPSHLHGVEIAFANVPGQTPGNPVASVQDFFFMSAMAVRMVFVMATFVEVMLSEFGLGVMLLNSAEASASAVYLTTGTARVS